MSVTHQAFFKIGAGRVQRISGHAGPAVGAYNLSKSLLRDTPPSRYRF